MRNYFYKAYGLSILSEFEIKALCEVSQRELDKHSLEIKFLPINYDGYLFKDDFVMREHTDKGFLYVIKNVVAFLITENQILVDPLLKNPRVWQSFLVGGAMSVVLNKRGFFLLHGSAIEYNDEAFVFLGASGVGKSSVAAALGQKGYKVITDDVCSLTMNMKDQLNIHQGTEQGRLLKNTVDVLGIQDTVAIAHPTIQSKFGYRYPTSISEKTVVKKIIELRVDERLNQRLQIEEISSFQKIELLQANIYKEELTRIVMGKPYGFQEIITSANHVDCLRISRNRGDYPLLQLVDCIEKEILRPEY